MSNVMTQLRAEAIVPKFGGSISMMCSMFIIRECILDHKAGKGSAVQRALVGMSVFDVMGSFAWFLSTWAVPKSNSTPFSAGNAATCNFQGFLLQFVIGGPLYNCSLALYYVLMIEFNWTNKRLRTIESYIHTVILFYAFATAGLGLPLTMYNQGGPVCWTYGFPLDCENSSSKPSDIPCERGNWSWLYGLILFYCVLWICVILTIIAMVTIYVHIRNTFLKNERYQFDSVHNMNGISSLDSTARGIPMEMALRPSPSETLFDSPSPCIRFPTTPVRSDHKRIDFKGELHDASCSEYQQENGVVDENGAAHQLQKPDIPDLDIIDPSKPHDDGSNEEYRVEHVKFAQERDSYQVNSAVVEQVDPTVLESRISFVNEFAVRPPRQSRISSVAGMKRRKKKQNMFATQAILYSLSFFITWTPSTVWSIAIWSGKTHFAFNMAAATCEPLQGLWNMLIFIRSRPSSQEKLTRVFGKCFQWFVNLLPAMPDEADASEPIGGD